MELQASRVFEDNYESRADITINRGGSSSTKTYSLIQKQILRLYTEERVLISVVRKTLPSLKKSVLKDFKDLLHKYGFYKDFIENKTDLTFIHKNTGSIIEFFSVDDEEKVRGPRRDYLWGNEANQIPYDIFQQLNIRTKKQTDIDFNPSDPNVWINSEIEAKLLNVIEKNKNVKDGQLLVIDPETKEKEYVNVRVIKSNYKDNPFLEHKVILDIKSKFPQYNEKGDLVSGDPNFWKIFGLGEYGSISGLIFRQPKIITQQEYKDVWLREGFGLDFGYSNSFTSLTGVKYDKENKKLYLNECIYERGLDPDQLEEIMKLHCTMSDEIVADYAEKEQIALYQRRGWNMHDCTSKDVKTRLGLMKRLEIFVTKESENIIKEFGLYKYKEDKNGNVINEPVKMYDHAMDGIGYRVMFEEAQSYGSFSGGIINR